MCAKWNDKNFNPGIITSELNKVRKQSAGKVEYKGWAFQPLRAALTSAIIFDFRIHESVRPRLINRALFAITPQGKLSTDDIVNEICDQERRYLSIPPKPYFLRSNLSISGPLPFNQYTFDRKKMAFKFSRSKFDQKGVPRYAVDHFHGPVPENYQPVLIDVRARSDTEAGNIALDYLDFVRGQWNLWLNSAVSLKLTAGKRQPVNQVRLGPLHTLHNQNGDLVEENFWWYEPNYIDPGKSADLSQNSNSLKKFSINCRRMLAGSGLKECAIEGLIRYTRALDHWNLETCYIELWSTLEYLTNSDRNANEPTIRRAASLYGNYQLALEIAKHLRERRNRLIHSAEQNEDVEILIYQLKNYVEHLLRFYISNQFKLNSRNEVSQFLDQPHDVGVLRRRMKLTQDALTYRGQ